MYTQALVTAYTKLRIKGVGNARIFKVRLGGEQPQNSLRNFRQCFIAQIKYSFRKLEIMPYNPRTKYSWQNNRKQQFNSWCQDVAWKAKVLSVLGHREDTFVTSALDRVSRQLDAPRLDVAREKNLLPQPWIEHNFLGHPSRKPTDIPAELPQFKYLACLPFPFHSPPPRGRCLASRGSLKWDDEQEKNIARDPQSFDEPYLARSVHD
jgi:hypothetical protein